MSTNENPEHNAPLPGQIGSIQAHPDWLTADLTTPAVFDPVFTDVIEEALDGFDEDEYMYSQAEALDFLYTESDRILAELYERWIDAACGLLSAEIDLYHGRRAPAPALARPLRTHYPFTWVAQQIDDIELVLTVPLGQNPFDLPICDALLDSVKSITPTERLLHTDELFRVLNLLPTRHLINLMELDLVHFDLLEEIIHARRQAAST